MRLSDREMLCKYRMKAGHTCICLQKNSYHLYERTFIAESNHKPLEMITLKSLVAAHPRLQRMLYLQQYDVTVQYHPGYWEMLLVDALSCPPSPISTVTIKLDLRTDHHGFTSSRLQELKAETAQDPVPSIAYCCTLDGRPEAWRHIPHIARAYWDQRDTCSTDNGLLIKGQGIVIPHQTNTELLTDLYIHCTFLMVYWPSIDANTEDFVHSCPSCLINKPNQTHETVHSPDIPGVPWKKGGIDIFDHDGQKSLATVDKFSNYPHVVTVKNTNTVQTIKCLKDIFSIEGVLSGIMSDLWTYHKQ